LITLAHPRLGVEGRGEVAGVVLDPVDTGGSCRRGDRADQPRDPWVVADSDHGEGLLDGRGSVSGDGPRLILDGVVEHAGGQYVRVAHLVVTQHPQRHPQRMVHVGLARTALPGVQLGRPAGCLGDRVAIDLGKAVELQQQPTAQTRLTVDLGDGVQRHHPQLRR
jgi:hypothetical protein